MAPRWCPGCPGLRDMAGSLTLAGAIASNHGLLPAYALLEVTLNLPLTNDEASLVRYALNELGNKRAGQALEGRISGSEWSEANDKEAALCWKISNRITEQQKALNNALDSSQPRS